jgi:outer membrane protein OmpA-like peptidoglycan-associated protein
MRIRQLLPLLLSSVALPAVAGDYATTCYTAVDSLGCIIEQAEFARQRNAEIDASIARVELARARELALSLTHCKSRSSRTPRCMAERAQRFASRQNALAEASIARVAEARAFEAARRAEAAASIAAVEAVRTRELERRQNALVKSSLAAVEVERQRRFAAYQNALATASVERVAAERGRQLASSLSPCKSESDTRPRCEAQRQREFIKHQRALAAASVQRVEAERARAFAAARNAEANASIAAVERARTTQRAAEYAAGISHCARNELSPRCEAERARQLQASLTHCQSAADTSPRCEAERAREFAAARNAEINASIAAVERNRAAASIETAAIVTNPNASIAAMTADEYAALTSHCVRAPESPRCEAERIREFAAARNAEIERSIAAVAAARMQARHAAATRIPGAGHPASYCATAPYSPVCRTEPSAEEYAALTSHCVRAPESPRCEAERIREFAAARNAEIERSIAAVAAARARGQLGNSTAATGNASTIAGSSPLETGAISIPTLPRTPEVRAIPDNLLRQDISTDPCRVKPFDALQFTRGATIDESMKPELDRLSNLAQSCPGVRIEVHGWADGGSPFNNRNLSQARAQAVADYLIANGVAPNRVAAMGRGGSRPVLPYSEGYDPAFGGRAEFIVRDPSTDAAARRVMWDLAELLDPTYIPAVANLSP